MQMCMKGNWKEFFSKVTPPYWYMYDKFQDRRGADVQRASQTDTLPSCPTGVCDDRGVWVGVHHPHLVSRLLLPLQRMAGTLPLRPQAFLCYRWAFFFSSCIILFSFFTPDFGGILSSGTVQSRVGLLLSFSLRSQKSAAHFTFPPFPRRTLWAVGTMSARTDF